MMWLVKRVVVDGWPLEKATPEAERIGLTHPRLKAYALRVPEGARQGLMAGSRDEDAAIGGDMDPEEFRREGHRVVDWLADYFAHPERFPVLAQVQPGDLVQGPALARA